MGHKNENVDESKFEMVLNAAAHLPGIRIRREVFLRKELSKFFDDDIVEKAIATNPAQAGIGQKIIEQIAKGCIKYEATKATALSTAAGIPGGLAMAATVPADLAQFFGHVIRILQKLVYLYGWQELFNDEESYDDETNNQLTLFIGVMFGVNAAQAVIRKLAHAIAIKAEKTLVRKALTKGVIYPIVKKVAQAIGVKMTKEIFAKGVGKVVPVIGGVVSGGLTLATFVPMSKKLQKYLATLPTADANYYKQHKDDEIIDIDFSDIEEDIEEDDEESIKVEQ
ncbi:MAG: hypothetical protein K2J80_04010 [Oscillospiraceae bacterium]|nr:hypothetical protein [Oscillospiraceae bacterium]